MKTLTLKENQTLYEVIAQQSPVDEPFVLEQGGRRIAVLLPPDEYEAYRAWRQAHLAVAASMWADDRTLEDVVADIKRRGPGVPNVRKATASLKDLLENAPHDPDFNLEEWTRDWAKIEAEMKESERRDWLKTEAEMRAVLRSEE
ncbi:MAG: hypothetical protein HY870_07555 [Chloroflexi bacterium]|nr:hypothetical protein [Chloroflexota bacterium]